MWYFALYGPGGGSILLFFYFPVWHAPKGPSDEEFTHGFH